MFLVRIWTILLFGKNSFPTTFKIVNNGTAIIIPIIPNKNPAISMTKNISSGLELTLFENINGCEILASSI